MTPTEIPLKVARVRRCALPRRLGSGPRAVLGIHGFTGYPGELMYPAEKLAQAGFTVVLPRLPGHGTCGADFNQSCGPQWLRAVIDAYLELKEEFDTVYVMGHSMGGILAVLLASLFPVEKMVLMAPAIKVQGPLFLSELMSFFGKNKSLKQPLWQPDPSVIFRDERDEDDDLFLGQEYWTWNYVRRTADLSRLRRRAVRRLPRVQASILTILGAQDRAVDNSGADLVARRSGGPCETVTLENSGHLVPYDKDYEKNAELTVSWFLK